MLKIAAIGEVLWDLFTDTKTLGGAPANFAHHCMRLGYKAHLLSAVGRDVLGEEALAELSQYGLAKNIQKNAQPTGSVEVQLEFAGDATYHFRPNSAWDNLVTTSQWREIATNSALLYFGSLAQRSTKSRKCIREIIEVASSNPNNIRFFDVNLRQNFYDLALITQSLRSANIVKLNDEEFRVLQNLLQLPSDRDLALEALIRKFELELILLTSDSAGSFAFTKEGLCYFAKAVEVEVVDSVGAGDAYAAAFVCSRLDGLSIIAAMERASAYAAKICQQKGAFVKY
ncbi:MAG: PfkB family carbohydrate kinase [Bradymonadia bacterium]|jgi:fructokinase